MTVPCELTLVETFGVPSQGSMVIEGDNLRVMASLYPALRRSINVVYIDPPYNTGNQNWRFPDRWEEHSDADRHERWLAFMRPRPVALPHDCCRCSRCLETASKRRRACPSRYRSR